MGLSWWGTDGTYCGPDTVAEPLEVVSAEMLRRHLLALGATATFGAPIKGLGELLAQLGDPAPVPLPFRLSSRGRCAGPLWRRENGVAFVRDAVVSVMLCSS
jgi:hypothetical protein